MYKCRLFLRNPNSHRKLTKFLHVIYSGTIQLTHIVKIISPAIQQLCVHIFTYISTSCCLILISISIIEWQPEHFSRYSDQATYQTSDEFRFDSRQKRRDFHLLRSVRTGPPFKGHGGGVKRPGHGDQPSLSNIQIKNEWSCTSTLPCLHDVHRGTLMRRWVGGLRGECNNGLTHNPLH